MTVQKIPKKEFEQVEFCSFCGKTRMDSRIYSNHAVGICVDCVEKINKKEKEKGIEIDSDIIKPSQIKDYLDKYVIGQERAKNGLSVGAWKYLIKMGNGTIDHMSIIGKTGTGKTLSARKLSECLGIPFANINATEFSEQGIVGKDADFMIYSLWDAAGRDKGLIESKGGIIYIDEVDKLARTGLSEKKMVDGFGVQRSLLKMTEGDSVDLVDYAKSHLGNKEYIDKIDTSKILFIISGAYHGIESIIADEFKTKNGFGFNSESGENNKISEKDLIGLIQPEHLIEYGMMPEFVARFARRVIFPDLTKTEYKRILTEPENSVVSEYKKDFKIYGLRLVFEDKALDMIAKATEQHPSHGRALRDMFVNMFGDDIEFALAEGQTAKYKKYIKGRNFVVDEDFVKTYLPRKIN